MNLDLSLNQNEETLWPELEKYVAFWGLEDEPMIRKAYDLAVKAHKDQKRESGEAYICHPVWVAKVVTQLGIGRKAIIAALLHDTVEDTEVTLDEIANEFDDEVALLVEGLTEVKKKTHGIEVHKTNVEVFRKFLFSSVDDVRVLIIRIVDKLHNGLTIGSLSEERQKKYALRTFGIYGPVAEYVGLHYFKRLLEDIAFKILYPEEAEKLEGELKEIHKYEIKALNLIEETISQMLKMNNINNFEITGRIKGLYSSYIKIKRHGKTAIKDRVGIRVIVNSIEECYMTLGLLHSRYSYQTNEFDDYISNPKPNGYRSIQTTLNWKENLTVEVQIRTREMHEFNEFGPASHIAYKMSKEQQKNINTGMGMAWVKDLVKWQEGDNNVKNYRINVLTKYIYVFTPKGDTVQLPVGSTALDYAYKIHSELGDRCNGTIVNGKMAKIDTILKTGDIVEILTSKKINANKNWLRFVKTSWAKERIRKAVTLKDI